MKLTFGLLLAAVAVTSTSAGTFDFTTISSKSSPTESKSGPKPASSSSDVGTFCPNACLDYMAPVTDENGVSYSNECYMQAAKCKNKKKSEDPVAEAEKLYGRPLFQYSDSNSGSNEVGSATQESGSASTPTKFVKGTKEDSLASSTSASGVDSSVGSYKGRSKNCAFACLAVYDPVTDEDGVTYSNECHMKSAKCKDDGKPYDPLAEAEKLYGPLFRYSDSNSGSDESASEENGSSSKMVKGTKAPVKSVKETPIVAAKDPVKESTEQTSQQSIVEKEVPASKTTKTA